MSKTKLLNKLIKKVCAKEKGKKQLNAGQAREIIKVIVQLRLSDDDFQETLANYFDLCVRDKK